jgi:hypothetical protein
MVLERIQIRPWGPKPRMTVLARTSSNLLDWTFTLHIPSWAPHTYNFVVLTSLTHLRKNILVVLEIGKAKDLSAPPRSIVSDDQAVPIVKVGERFPRNVGACQVKYIHVVTTPPPEKSHIDTEYSKNVVYVVWCSYVTGIWSATANVFIPLVHMGAVVCYIIWVWWQLLAAPVAFARLVALHADLESKPPGGTDPMSRFMSSYTVTLPDNRAAAVLYTRSCGTQGWYDFLANQHES